MSFLMAIKKIRFYILFTFLFISAAIYLFYSLQYYYTLHPERIYSTQLNSYTEIAELKVDINSNANDSVEKFQGHKTVLIDENNSFGPGQMVTFNEKPEFRTYDRILITGDFKSADFTGVGVVLQIDDSTGKNIYWENQPVISNSANWEPLAFLFAPESNALMNGSVAKFFTINEKQKRFNVGSFNIRFYKKK